MRINKILILIIIILLIILGIGYFYLQKPKESKQHAPVPDIKKSEPLSNSDLRNAELAKISSKLPYSDTDNKYSIEYYEKSKDLVITIQNVDNLNSYRTVKVSAEAKLIELGTQNPCYLVVSWVAPENIRKSLSRLDLLTKGCD